MKLRITIPALAIATLCLIGCDDSSSLQHAGFGDTALHEAAEAGDLKAMERLLDDGAEIHGIDFESRTPITAAAESGQVDAVRLLLRRGAGLERTDDLDRTVLMAASQYGQMAVVKLLLERGASLEPVVWTPLHFAALGPHNHPKRVEERIAVAEVLIDAGLSPNEMDEDGIGETPLFLAARRCDVKMIRYLVSKGAEVSTLTNGQTPLHYAAKGARPRSEFRETVEYLIGLGVQIDAKNGEGETALLIAVQRQDEGRVDVLLDNGADPSIGPLLHHAMWSVPVAKKLVEHGADLSARDDLARTPVDVAEDLGNAELVEYLQSVQ